MHETYQTVLECPYFALVEGSFFTFVLKSDPLSLDSRWPHSGQYPDSWISVIGSVLGVERPSNDVPKEWHHQPDQHITVGRLHLRLMCRRFGRIFFRGNSEPTQTSECWLCANYPGDIKTLAMDGCHSKPALYPPQWILKIESWRSRGQLWQKSRACSEGASDEICLRSLSVSDCSSVNPLKHILKLVMPYIHFQLLWARQHSREYVKYLTLQAIARLYNSQTLWE